MLHLLNPKNWWRSLPPKPEDPPKSPVKPLPDPYGCQEALDEFDRQTAGFKPTVKPLVEAKPILSQEEFQQAFFPAVIHGAMNIPFRHGDDAVYCGKPGTLHYSPIDGWYFITDDGAMTAIDNPQALTIPPPTWEELARALTSDLPKTSDISDAELRNIDDRAFTDPDDLALTAARMLGDGEKHYGKFTDDPDDIISATAPDNLPDGICYMNDARNLRFRVTYGSGKDRVTKNCANLHDAVVTREAFEAAAKKWRVG